MKLAMIGLEGEELVRRLVHGGHSCILHEPDPAKRAGLEIEGTRLASSFGELPRHLDRPAVAWMTLPPGQETEEAFLELSGVLQAGDIIVDAGCSHFEDDIRRAETLRELGIRFLDVGVSGGFCLTIGGDETAMDLLEPVFLSLAPSGGTVPISDARRSELRTADLGYLHCGPAGSGHFVKSVHDAIEAGMTQSLAEGFDLLRGGAVPRGPGGEPYRFELGEIAEVWRRGSRLSSVLLDAVAASLGGGVYPPRSSSAGDEKWALQAALEQGIPLATLSSAHFASRKSRSAA